MLGFYAIHNGFNDFRMKTVFFCAASASSFRFMAFSERWLQEWQGIRNGEV